MAKKKGIVSDEYLEELLINWPQEIYLPNRTISVVGDVFDDGARALLKAQSEPPNTGHYLPIANLSAHAIELYLKSLWVFNRPQVPDFRKKSPPAKGSDRFVDGRSLAPQSKDVEKVKHDLTKSWKKIPKFFADKLVAERPTIEAELEPLNGLFARSRCVYDGANCVGIYYKEAAEVSGFLRQMVSDFPQKSIRELSLI